MPEPHQFIADLMRRYEWDENNPTLLREWKNKWVLDVQALWVRYKENINHYRQLPNITPHKWNYIMGIDLGFKDADAIAIIAWHENEPKAYLVEEIIESKQGITELINQINGAMRKYDISKMVIDEGGLGKKIAEELRRQHGIPVQQADKAQKQQNVEFLNDALRTGKFMAKSASKFAQDSYLVQIDWEKSRPDKIIIKKKPHSDIIDAVLYAFRECPIFAYTPPVIGPKYGTKEWADQQQSEMFDSAIDFFEKQSSSENY
jgi:phage terminase large subunit-like protein